MKFLAQYYANERFVKVMPFDNDEILDDNRYLNANDCNGTNRKYLN